jgi:hypothetical protein
MANGCCKEHGGQGGKSQVCNDVECVRWPIVANGYCMEHGSQRQESQLCKDPDCERWPKENGYCTKHGVPKKKVCNDPFDKRKY